jgi:glycosyltransferase involved in cell wall biosynthesis
MGPGGAERVAATLSDAWVRRGDRVTLVATCSKPGRSFYPLDPAVRFVSLAAQPEVRGWRPLRAVRRFVSLRRLLQSERPDVVVSFLTNVNVKAVLASIGLRLPVVVSEHTYPPAHREKRLLELLRRVVYPQASCVTMLTGEGLTWARRTFPRTPAAVVPNPVVYPMRESEPVLEVDRIVPSTGRFVLSAGRFDAGKQFDHLIDAFARVAPACPEWRLVVLGDGPERGRLETIVRRHGLAGRVLMPGRAGNMADWYRRASLFAMTSRYEGFPMALAEALAHGCPSVSYDCDTGPRDLIEHGVNGLLVPPREGVDGIARAIGALIDDLPRREAMSARADACRSRYSIDAVLARWDEVLVTAARMVVAERGAGGSVGVEADRAS